MVSIEVESLLEPLSPDSPCGENLEYDPQFGEMERASQGKPEQQMGDTVVAAEGPDWKQVKKQALELLGRTKDLRVGLYLARAAVATDGFPGFAQALKLLRGHVENFWDSVHPELDPDDDNDPTMRINVITSLCDGDTVLKSVKEAPLVESRVLGRYCLRDLEVASGAIPAPENGSEPPTAATIEAAFMDSELDALQATTTAVAESIEAVEAIENSITEQVGASQAPNLSALRELLQVVHKNLAEPQSRRGVAVDSTQDEAPAADGTAGPAVAGAPAAAAPPPPPGSVNSREDVILYFDKICDYYRRNEPSSPVPVLVERAKRLVTKDFMAILRDLAPDGVSQAEMIRGVDTEEGSA